MKTFKLDLDSDGILTAALDVPGRSMNTLTHEVLSDLATLVERLRTDDTVKALVLASGKTNGFCAGADLEEEDADNKGIRPESDEAKRASFERVSKVSRMFRLLETCGKPVASAISGLALGGGLELLLATHYRVAADNPRIQLGLPESKIGLLPGAGGTQRLPRLIGIEAALPLMLSGNPVDSAKALKLGFVNEVAAAGDEIAAAKRWIRAGGEAVQPWDRKGFKLPGGGPYEIPGQMAMATSLMHKQTYGNYPGQLNILRCVYEGSMVPIDVGLKIETRLFIQTAESPRAKAMVRSLFLSMQEAKKGAARPKSIPPAEIRKLAILGAGMMGAGIALVSAEAGIDVVLLDRTDADAARGKAWAEKELAKAVEKGRTTADKAQVALSRITATTDYESIRGADYVVEAVFENREVKAEVTRRAEVLLGDGAVFGTNTSGLPITELAAASSRPGNFIGIHFFSPVNRMALVEIIRGKQTSDEALAKTIDFVRMIKKTPIVVNDSRGFFTSRSVYTYLNEGWEMLREGISPIVIDNVGRATGMPRGPLELSDDVGLDLCLSSRKQEQADLGDGFVPNAHDALLPAIVEGAGRHGRKNGKGLYDYPDVRGPKHLWPGLAGLAPVTLSAPTDADVEDIRDRLLYRQALEAARVHAEGVIDHPRDADIGALLGWGFPGWTGGPLSLIDQLGTAAFVARADELAGRYGERFEAPAKLREMAARGESYYS